MGHSNRTMTWIRSWDNGMGPGYGTMITGLAE